MSFTPINLGNVEPQKGDNRLGDMFANILEGYKASQVPGELSRKKQREQSTNLIKAAEAKHAPEYYKGRAESKKNESFINMLKGKNLEKYGSDQAAADLAHTQAQTEKYKREGVIGGGSKTNLGKLLAERTLIEKEEGPDSRKLAKYDEAITKAFSITTAPVRTQAQQRPILNTAREFIAEKVAMPKEYTGALAEINIIKDATRYPHIKNPKEKKELYDRLTTAIAAERILPEYSMVQLGSQPGGKMTVHAGKLQEKAIRQGWPKGLHKIINNMPQDIIEGGKQKHDDAISQLNDITGNAYSEILSPHMPTNLKNAQRVGGKNSHISILDPNGIVRKIPIEKLTDAMDAGATLHGR